MQGNALSRHQLCERGTPIAFNKLAVYARAGVGTVYRHFASSDELLDEIIARRVDAVVAILEAAVAEQNRSRRFARRYWGLYCKRPAAASPKLAGPRFECDPQRILPPRRLIVERAQASWRMRPEFSGTDFAVRS